MPIAVTDAPYRPVPLDPPRKRWTRDEYESLAGTGLFEGRKYELVEGELIDKMGKNRGHATCLMLMLGWLIEVFSLEYINSETSIDVAPGDNPTSEPEPDLIVLSRPTWEIQDRNPKPEEIRLAVEISDTTLGFDLTKKAGLYARASITEYWVLDVAKHRMIVHRHPVAGRYSEVAAYGEEETVSPLAAPEAAFGIASIFRRD